MACSFEFDSTNKILLARFDGEVNDESFGKFYRVEVPVVATSRVFRGYIVDFSGVTEFRVTPETLRALAWSRPADPDSSRLRVLVAPAPNVFGLARMFAAHGEDTRPNLHVVRSLREAYAVFGVQTCEFAPLGEPGSGSS